MMSRCLRSGGMSAPAAGTLKTRAGRAPARPLTAPEARSGERSLMSLRGSSKHTLSEPRGSGLGAGSLETRPSGPPQLRAADERGPCSDERCPAPQSGNLRSRARFAPGTSSITTGTRWPAALLLPRTPGPEPRSPSPRSRPSPETGRRFLAPSTFEPSNPRALEPSNLRTLEPSNP